MPEFSRYALPVASHFVVDDKFAENRQVEYLCNGALHIFLGMAK